MKNINRIICLITAAVMLGSCTDKQQSGTEPTTAEQTLQSAAAQSETSAPQAETEKTNEAPLSEETSVPESEADTDKTMPVREEVANAIEDIRGSMVGTSQLFAASYLGYYSADCGDPLDVWLRGSNPCQLTDNPFIAEIPEERIVGSAGHLYCIIPRSEAASVAVNRIHWDYDTFELVTDEVAYRSESGEPILVFCNADKSSYEHDTNVTIVSDGDSAVWEPALNALGRLDISAEGVDPFVLDFTNRYDMNLNYEEYLSTGWLGTTELGIAGENGSEWTVSKPAWNGKNAVFSLKFNADTSVSLDWKYSGEAEFEEHWNGWWTIETEIDQPSLVTISLSRVGGRNFDMVDAPMYISETYPVLISPSGEKLMIFGGKYSVLLPFMSSDEPFSELSLS